MHFECGLYLSRKDRSNPQHLTTVLTPGKSWEEQLYRSWDERSCFLSVWQLSFVRTALNNNRNSPLARAHQGSPWVYRKVHYNTNSRNESMGTQCFFFFISFFSFFYFLLKDNLHKKAHKMSVLLSFQKLNLYNQHSEQETLPASHTLQAPFQFINHHMTITHLTPNTIDGFCLSVHVI